MSYLMNPQIYPLDLPLFGDSFRDFVSKEAAFNRVAIKPELRPVKAMSQLDNLPNDLNLLAAFHGVKPSFLSSLGGLISFLLLAGGALSFPLIVMFAGDWFDSLDPAVAQIIGLGGFVMLLIIAGFVVTEVIARRPKADEPKASSQVVQWHRKGGMRLGMGWIVLDKPKYAPGDTIRFIYSQKVVKPTQLRGGAIRLILFEASRNYAITYEIHNQDDVELSRVEIPAGSYQADNRIQVRGEFTLPAYAPAVLITPNHRMVYMLAVKLDVAEQTTGELLYHLPVEPSVIVDKVEQFI